MLTSNRKSRRTIHLSGHVNFYEPHKCLANDLPKYIKCITPLGLQIAQDSFSNMRLHTALNTRLAHKRNEAFRSL